MTPNVDPWRTLGLAPGATADEVRRAYRRLAKANHPDAAGETALPRFLAIQAAYEQLVGATVRRRPGSRPGGARSTPAEPWRADPDRARASGRADGRRPGARPGGGRRGAGPTADEGSAAGTADGETAPGGGGRRSRADASGAGSAAGGAGGEGPTRSRRGGGRRRAPNKAGPYSTSYDPADEEPFEPGWSGGSWYGTSSGTYWTINPKEYADPRKHGPEYQRRARRSAGDGWIHDGDGEPPEGVAPEDARAEASEAAHPPAGSPPASEGARPRASRTWVRPERREGSGESAGAPPPFVRPQRPADSAAANPGLPRLRAPTTSVGRLAIALLGWPPLGLAAATAIGESSGCGRFAASCGELSSPGTWIVQAAILILLLALPRVAAWSAHGALAALVVGAPAAVVLSAGGGARQPETSASVLTLVVVAAYIFGVVYALAAPRWGDRSRVP
jgi:curved DNA-binding protein CbpA